MTDPIPADQATGATARVRAFLDARDAALAHIPPIGPGVIAGWPRTEDDADGDYDLTASDLRTVLAALDSAQERAAELERTPRCGHTTPGLMPDTYVGPCTLPAEHVGSHEDDRHCRWSEAPGSDRYRLRARNAELTADRDRLAARVTELETRIRATSAAIEQRARIEDATGIAATYCAWWDASALVDQTLGINPSDGGESGDETRPA